MKLFKTTIMKAVTFFALSFTVNPLFAGHIEIYVDAGEDYDPNIKRLYFRIPKKHGSPEIPFWSETDKSCTKTIVINEDSPQTFLYFLWKNNKEQFVSLLPSKTLLPPLTKAGYPLRSLKITLGKQNTISNLKYELDEEECSALDEISTQEYIEPQ